MHRGAVLNPHRVVGNSAPAGALFVPSSALPPSQTSTGPRIALTANPTTTQANGFNVVPDGDGIKRYSGVYFTGVGMQFAGTAGGSHTIQGYSFTDCRFAKVSFFASIGTGTAGLTFDHCTFDDITTIQNSGYQVTATRCNFQGATNTPLQSFRYTTGGVAATTLFSTPTTMTACLFKLGYPVVANGNHRECIHISGGKDMLFQQCMLDLGWATNPDGSTPQLTANYFVEGANGGNDSITLDGCWHYGKNPSYVFVLEGTNLVMQNGYLAQMGPYNDLSNDGSGKPGPSLDVSNKMGAASTFSISGYRWLADNTSVAAGTAAVEFNNTHPSVTWF